MLESEIQAGYFEWVKWQANSSWRYQAIHASMNGATFGSGPRERAIRGRLAKKTGMLNGVWDVFVPVPCYFEGEVEKCGLYIEFKQKNGKLREEQKNFGKIVNETGYALAVCRSVDEGIMATASYLKETKEWIKTQLKKETEVQSWESFHENALEEMNLYLLE